MKQLLIYLSFCFSERRLFLFLLGEVQEAACETKGRQTVG